MSSKIFNYLSRLFKTADDGIQETQGQFIPDIKDKIMNKLYEIKALENGEDIIALEPVIDPWRFLSDEEIVYFKLQFQRSYKRNLYPFARKEDSDDFACLEDNQGDIIYIIHAFSTSGWEEHGKYNFELWYARALEDSKNFHYDDKYVAKTGEHNLEDPDGYAREAAINEIELTKEDDKLIQTLERLLIRANDWVPQVRFAATKKIIEILDNINPEQIIKLLPHIYRLQNCRRANHEQLIGKMEDHLLKAPIDVLLNGVNDHNQKVARACFAIIMRDKLLPLISVVELGLKHVDVIINLRASYLLKNLSKDEFDYLYPTIFNMKNPFVRREVIRGCAQFDSQVSPRIVKGLLDQSVAVASTASYYAKQLGFDFKEFYLDVLSNKTLYSQKILNQVIASIKNYNISELYPTLLNYYHDSPSIKARLAALKTLISFDEFNLNDEIINMCVEEDPLLAKISSDILDRLPIPVAESNIFYDFLGDSCSIETKRFVTKVLLQVKGFWDNLIVLMAIYEKVSNQEFQILGLEYLCSNLKYNHVYLRKPSYTQIEIIKKWIIRHPDAYLIINLVRNDRHVAEYVMPELKGS